MNETETLAAVRFRLMVAINDLIARYSYFTDTRDVEGWLSLFADGGCWVAYRASGEIFLQGRGHHELRDAIQQVFAGSDGYQTRHFQTNTMLTKVAPGDISARTPVIVTWAKMNAVDPAPVLLKRTGHYDDEFVETDQGMKFKKRTIHLDQ